MSSQIFVKLFILIYCCCCLLTSTTNAEAAHSQKKCAAKLIPDFGYTVDCSNRNRTSLPKLPEDVAENLKALDMSGNKRFSSISSTQLESMPNLEILQLHDTGLTKFNMDISQSIEKSIKILSLGMNKFPCDCSISLLWKDYMSIKEIMPRNLIGFHKTENTFSRPKPQDSTSALEDEGTGVEEEEEYFRDDLAANSTEIDWLKLPTYFPPMVCYDRIYKEWLPLEDANLIHCKEEFVPKVKGGWSSWSSWDMCNIDCGPGIKTRTRSCTNPPPSTDEYRCDGPGHETMKCNVFCNQKILTLSSLREFDPGGEERIILEPKEDYTSALPESPWLNVKKLLLIVVGVQLMILFSYMIAMAVRRGIDTRKKSKYSMDSFTKQSRTSDKYLSNPTYSKISDAIKRRTSVQRNASDTMIDMTPFEKMIIEESPSKLIQRYESPNNIVYENVNDTLHTGVTRTLETSLQNVYEGRYYNTSMQLQQPIAEQNYYNIGGESNEMKSEYDVFLDRRNQLEKEAREAEKTKEITSDQLESSDSFASVSSGSFDAETDDKRTYENMQSPQEKDDFFTLIDKVRGQNQTNDLNNDNADVSDNRTYENVGSVDPHELDNFSTLVDKVREKNDQNDSSNDDEWHDNTDVTDSRIYENVDFPTVPHELDNFSTLVDKVREKNEQDDSSNEDEWSDNADVADLRIYQNVNFPAVPHELDNFSTLVDKVREQNEQSDSSNEDEWHDNADHTDSKISENVNFPAVPHELDNFSTLVDKVREQNEQSDSSNENEWYDNADQTDSRISENVEFPAVPHELDNFSTLVDKVREKNDQNESSNEDEWDDNADGTDKNDYENVGSVRPTELDNFSTLVDKVREQNEQSDSSNEDQWYDNADHTDSRISENVDFPAVPHELDNFSTLVDKVREKNDQNESSNDEEWDDNADVSDKKIYENVQSVETDDIGSSQAQTADDGNDKSKEKRELDNFFSLIDKVREQNKQEDSNNHNDDDDWDDDHEPNKHDDDWNDDEENSQFTNTPVSVVGTSEISQQVQMDVKDTSNQPNIERKTPPQKPPRTFSSQYEVTPIGSTNIVISTEHIDTNEACSNEINKRTQSNKKLLQTPTTSSKDISKGDVPQKHHTSMPPKDKQFVPAQYKSLRQSQKAKSTALKRWALIKKNVLSGKIVSEHKRSLQEPNRSDETNKLSTEPLSNTPSGKKRDLPQFLTNTLQQWKRNIFHGKVTPEDKNSQQETSGQDKIEPTTSDIKTPGKKKQEVSKSSKKSKKALKNWEIVRKNVFSGKITSMYKDSQQETSRNDKNLQLDTTNKSSTVPSSNSSTSKKRELPKLLTNALHKWESVKTKVKSKATKPPSKKQELSQASKINALRRWKLLQKNVISGKIASDHKKSLQEASKKDGRKLPQTPTNAKSKALKRWDNIVSTIPHSKMSPSKNRELPQPPTRETDASKRWKFIKKNVFSGRIVSEHKKSLQKSSGKDRRKLPQVPTSVKSKALKRWKLLQKNVISGKITSDHKKSLQEASKKDERKLLQAPTSPKSKALKRWDNIISTIPHSKMSPSKNRELPQTPTRETDALKRWKFIKKNVFSGRIVSEHKKSLQKSSGKDRPLQHRHTGLSTTPHSNKALIKKKKLLYKYCKSRESPPPPTKVTDALKRWKFIKQNVFSGRIVSEHKKSLQKDRTLQHRHTGLSTTKKQKLLYKYCKSRESPPPLTKVTDASKRWKFIKQNVFSGRIVSEHKKSLQKDRTLQHRHTGLSTTKKQKLLYKYCKSRESPPPPTKVTDALKRWKFIKQNVFSGRIVSEHKKSLQKDRTLQHRHTGLSTTKKQKLLYKYCKSRESPQPPTKVTDASKRWKLIKQNVFSGRIVSDHTKSLQKDRPLQHRHTGLSTTPHSSNSSIHKQKLLYKYCKVDVQNDATKTNLTSVADSNKPQTSTVKPVIETKPHSFGPGIPSDRVLPQTLTKESNDLAQTLTKTNVTSQNDKPLATKVATRTIKPADKYTEELQKQTPLADSSAKDITKKTKVPPPVQRQLSSVEGAHKVRRSSIGTAAKCRIFELQGNGDNSVGNANLPTFVGRFAFPTLVSSSKLHPPVQERKKEIQQPSTSVQKDREIKTLTSVAGSILPQISKEKPFVSPKPQFINQGISSNKKRVLPPATIAVQSDLATKATVAKFENKDTVVVKSILPTSLNDKVGIKDTMNNAPTSSNGGVSCLRPSAVKKQSVLSSPVKEATMQKQTLGETSQQTAVPLQNTITNEKTSDKPRVPPPVMPKKKIPPVAPKPKPIKTENIASANSKIENSPTKRDVPPFTLAPKPKPIKTENIASANNKIEDVPTKRDDTVTPAATTKIVSSDTEEMNESNQPSMGSVIKNRLNNIRKSISRAQSDTSSITDFGTSVEDLQGPGKLYIPSPLITNRENIPNVKASNNEEHNQDYGSRTDDQIQQQAGVKFSKQNKAENDIIKNINAPSIRPLKRRATSKVLQSVVAATEVEKTINTSSTYAAKDQGKDDTATHSQTSLERRRYSKEEASQILNDMGTQLQSMGKRIDDLHRNSRSREHIKPIQNENIRTGGAGDISSNQIISRQANQQTMSIARPELHRRKRITLPQSVLMIKAYQNTPKDPLSRFRNIVYKVILNLPSYNTRKITPSVPPKTKIKAQDTSKPKGCLKESKPTPVEKSTFKSEHKPKETVEKGRKRGRSDSCSSKDVETLAPVSNLTALTEIYSGENMNAIPQKQTGGFKNTKQKKEHGEPKAMKAEVEAVSTRPVPSPQLNPGNLYLHSQDDHIRQVDSAIFPALPTASTIIGGSILDRKGSIRESSTETLISNSQPNLIETLSMKGILKDDSEDKIKHEESDIQSNQTALSNVIGGILQSNSVKQKETHADNKNLPMLKSLIDKYITTPKGAEASIGNTSNVVSNNTTDGNSKLGALVDIVRQLKRTKDQTIVMGKTPQITQEQMNTMLNQTGSRNSPRVNDKAQSSSTNPFQPSTNPFSSNQYPKSQNTQKQRNEARNLEKTKDKGSPEHLVKQKSNETVQAKTSFGRMQTVVENGVKKTILVPYEAPNDVKKTLKHKTTKDAALFGPSTKNQHTTETTKTKVRKLANETLPSENVDNRHVQLNKHNLKQHMSVMDELTSGKPILKKTEKIHATTAEANLFGSKRQTRPKASASKVSLQTSLYEALASKIESPTKEATITEVWKDEDWETDDSQNADPKIQQMGKSVHNKTVVGKGQNLSESVYGETPRHRGKVGESKTSPKIKAPIKLPQISENKNSTKKPESPGLQNKGVTSKPGPSGFKDREAVRKRPQMHQHLSSELKKPVNHSKVGEVRKIEEEPQAEKVDYKRPQDLFCEIKTPVKLRRITREDRSDNQLNPKKKDSVKPLFNMPTNLMSEISTKMESAQVKPKLTSTKNDSASVAKQETPVNPINQSRQEGVKPPQVKRQAFSLLYDPENNECIKVTQEIPGLREGDLTTRPITPPKPGLKERELIKPITQPNPGLNEKDLITKPITSPKPGLQNKDDSSKPGPSGYKGRALTNKPLTTQPKPGLQDMVPMPRPISSAEPNQLTKPIPGTVTKPNPLIKPKPGTSTKPGPLTKPVQGTSQSTKPKQDVHISNGEKQIEPAKVTTTQPKPGLQDIGTKPKPTTSAKPNTFVKPIPGTSAGPNPLIKPILGTSTKPNPLVKPKPGTSTKPEPLTKPIPGTLLSAKPKTDDIISSREMLDKTHNFEPTKPTQRTAVLPDISTKPLISTKPNPLLKPKPGTSLSTRPKQDDSMSSGTQNSEPTKPPITQQKPGLQKKDTTTKPTTKPKPTTQALPTKPKPPISTKPNPLVKPKPETSTKPNPLIKPRPETSTKPNPLVKPKPGTSLSTKPKQNDDTSSEGNTAENSKTIGDKFNFLQKK